MAELSLIDYNYAIVRYIFVLKSSNSVYEN